MNGENRGAYMILERKLNNFEKLLLLTGLAIGIVGFVFINFIFKADDSVMTWEMLTTVFLWLNLIFLVILCAIQENQREETGIIIKKHSEETRLLRQITGELHEEIKLMRIDLGYTHNKILDAHKELVTIHQTKKVAKPASRHITKKKTKKR